MLSKSQIDRIGERLRAGEIDAATLRALEEYRNEFAVAYDHVEREIQRLGHRVSGRPSKSTVSIVDKLRRESIRLSQVQDIAGCRVIVPSLRAQDSLCHAAGVMLGDVRLVDRRKTPTHGYRAVHLIARTQGKFVEIQVRTRFQNFWAEVSEKMADRYGQGLKYGQGDPWAVQWLSKLSLLAQTLENRTEAVLTARAAGKKFKDLERLELLARHAFYDVRAAIKALDTR